MALEFTADYLQDALSLFRYYKKLIDGALAQVSDEDFFRAPAPESNSLAIVLKHLIGNLRSRWTDFLTSDGEKPWRTRDAEFERDGDETRASLLAGWEAACELAFFTLARLGARDLAREVRIRGEAHSVQQACNRQLAHFAYHAGQIVFLAKQWQGASWRSLSIPRGASTEFNRRVQTGAASQR